MQESQPHTHTRGHKSYSKGTMDENQWLPGVHT